MGSSKYLSNETEIILIPIIKPVSSSHKSKHLSWIIMRLRLVLSLENNVYVMRETFGTDNLRYCTSNRIRGKISLHILISSYHPVFLMIKLYRLKLQFIITYPLLEKCRSCNLKTILKGTKHAKLHLMRSVEWTRASIKHVVNERKRVSKQPWTCFVKNTRLWMHGKMSRLAWSVWCGSGWVITTVLRRNAIGWFICCQMSSNKTFNLQTIN